MKRIVTALILAGACHLGTHYGTQFDRYQICFKPSESNQNYCEDNIDLVVLKRLYDLGQYIDGSNPDFQSEWINLIKKTQIIKNLPATNPLIPVLGFGTVASLFIASYWQNQKVKQLQFKLPGSVEAFASETYLLWSEGFHDRRVKHRLNEFSGDETINREINKVKSKPELAYLQKQFERNEQIIIKQHEGQLTQYDVMIAEAKKKIAEADKDRVKAEKETDKLTNQRPSAKTVETSNQELIDQLIDVLGKHEDGWLLKAIKNIAPMFILGDMGTGKTSTAVAIALVRFHCLGIPIYRVADRHLKGENNKYWKLLESEKQADHDTTIIEALQDTCERRLDRIAQNLPENQAEQFILDEFTQLKDIDEQTVKTFVKSTFSDTRKAKERFIGITHLTTNEAFGEGTASLRKGGYLIERFTATGDRPLPRVVIRHGIKDELGNKLEDVERTIPEWFEGTVIYNHFHGKPIEF